MNTKHIVSTLAMTGLIFSLGTSTDSYAENLSISDLGSLSDTRTEGYATLMGILFLREAGTHFQAANFHDFPAGTVPQPGAGTLIRSPQSVHARFAMGGLDADAAYTMWWVIWNDPSACATSPCGLADLGAPGNAVQYATGFVTGADGTANVSTDLTDDAPPVGLNVIIPGGLAKSNGFGAEIHLLVQSHGGIDPGYVDLQISIDFAACNPECVIQQAIMFPPVN